MFYGRRHNGGITPDLRYESVGRGFESLPSHHTKQIRTYFFLKVRSDLFFISIHIDRSPYNKKTSKNSNFDCVT